MSVTRLPSGRWLARLPRAAGRASESFDEEIEARRWLRAMRESMAAQTKPDGTLRSWGVTVLERRQKAGLASARGDGSRWAHVLDGDLADMALAAAATRIQPAADQQSDQCQVQDGDASPVGGPGGIRTHDQRLKRRLRSGGDTDGCAAHWPVTGQGADLARAVLLLTEAGATVPGELLAGLADLVLDQPAVQLALAVRAGGEHVLTAAVQLAEIVVAAAAEVPAQPGAKRGDHRAGPRESANDDR